MYESRKVTRDEVMLTTPMVRFGEEPSVVPIEHVPVGSSVRIVESQNNYDGCFGHLVEVDSEFAWVEMDLRFGLQYYPIVPVPRSLGLRVLAYPAPR
jgi:hypothetical protein